MTIAAGRPTRNESLVPPKVFTALALVATGTSFEKAAETVSMTGKALRKWRSHKDVKDYLEEIPRENDRGRKTKRENEREREGEGRKRNGESK